MTERFRGKCVAKNYSTAGKVWRESGGCGGVFAARKKVMERFRGKNVGENYSTAGEV